MPQVFLANATTTIDGSSNLGTRMSVKSTATASSVISANDASNNAYNLSRNIAYDILQHDIGLVSIAVHDAHIQDFTISSTNVSTNSWSFTIPNIYGRAFTYSLFSDTSAVPVSKTIAKTPAVPITYGAITNLSGGFIYAAGAGVLQPYNGQTTDFTDTPPGNRISTLTANGSAYMMSLVNMMGGILTWDISSNNPVNSKGNFLPDASFNTSYVLSCQTPFATIAPCKAILIGHIVAV